jgi:uncharacterized protein YjbJ (UPF0337 family)
MFIVGNCEGTMTWIPHGASFKYEHTTTNTETTMNWDQIQGNWKQVKGQAQQKWGKLTDDQLDVIDGNREELVGKVQEQYGIAREEAEKQVDEFQSTCNC